jgi:pimeloyl-ACP methyl ester carboxylesterase
VDAWNEPSRLIAAPDGTPIAVFTSGSGPALVLVHGTTGDHTTFRVVRPHLEPRFTLYAIDRRGRGASGDGARYAIEREFEDVAAVAGWAAAEAGGPIVVVGHSYGGRVALGAARTTGAIRAVVCYEGAPAPPGSTYHPDRIEDRLRERLRAGDREGAHSLFMREVVGMSEANLERYRADPVWPARVAAAHTILRELEAETAPAASLQSLGAVRQPVLQVLGGASLTVFREATLALDARLADGRVVVIDGARHGAHHTHPEPFVAAIETFVSSLARS